MPSLKNSFLLYLKDPTMNKAHRIVWNHKNNQWQVASEHAKTTGKNSKSVRIITALISSIGTLLISPVANAACDVPSITSI